MALVGYARISTAEGGQIMDRQLDALAAAGCERVFEDRASGATGAEDRPGLKACLDWLRAGDVLVVLDLDRLGRLAGELVQLIDALAAREVAFRAINSPMDTTTPQGRAFLQIQGLCRDGAQRHSSKGQGGPCCGACPRAQGRAAPRHDDRQAALRPAPHGRLRALDPLDLRRTGRDQALDPVSLPSRRWRAEVARAGTAR